MITMVSEVISTKNQIINQSHHRQNGIFEIAVRENEHISKNRIYQSIAINRLKDNSGR